MSGKQVKQTPSLEMEKVGELTDQLGKMVGPQIKHPTIQDTLILCSWLLYSQCFVMKIKLT